MVDFISTKGKNPNYMVHIACPGHNINVVADIPEQFSFGVTSDWESLLPYSLAGILDSALGAFGRSVGGALGAASKSYNAQSQALSFQIWMGTSPIEIPLTLQLDARTSALEDVYKPLCYLAALGMPINKGLLSSSAFDNILLPPGPSFGGGAGDINYAVHLRVGKMVTLLDCILTSSSPTFDTRLDDAGYPIAGEIEMTFRTSKVYGHKDLLNAMGIGTI